jgi:hypothetical protein
MKPAFAIAALILAVPFAAPAFAEAALKTIPVEYHGEWSSVPEACGNRESGERFVINETSITYFEEGDDVVAVTRIDPNTIHLVVDYQDYDGIERLQRTLILSDDRQMLSFYYGDGPENVSRRCPQGNPDGQ